MGVNLKFLLNFMEFIIYKKLKIRFFLRREIIYKLLGKNIWIYFILFIEV